jgi:hypothetical protein
MLDDVERRRLAEIEAWFEADDPDLTRRLARGRSYRQTLFVMLVITVATLAVTAGAMLVGPPAGIAAGLTVAAIVVGCRFDRRSRSGAARRKR